MGYAARPCSTAIRARTSTDPACERGKIGNGPAASAGSCGLVCSKEGFILGRSGADPTRVKDRRHLRNELFGEIDRLRACVAAGVIVIDHPAAEIGTHCNGYN